ncbi:MAG: hypothetical protein R3C56_15235 [Pirellulaceae bacterium]
MSSHRNVRFPKIAAMQFAPDGQFLATIDCFAKLSLWSAAAEERVPIFERQSIASRAKDYAANGQYEKAESLYSN